MCLVVQSGAIPVSLFHLSVIFANLDSYNQPYMFLPQSLPGSLWQELGGLTATYTGVGLRVAVSLAALLRADWDRKGKNSKSHLLAIRRKGKGKCLCHVLFILWMSVCISACFFHLVWSQLFFLIALWALVLDYVLFNLLKATCDLTTEKAACGNGGWKALEMLAVWLLKGCRKENWRKSTKERGC